MTDMRLLKKYLRAKRKLERKLDDVNRELSRIISQMEEKDQELWEKTFMLFQAFPGHG